MRYGSVCSGIESATVAWHPLGWRAAFFAEIERFPSAVLAHHFPGVRNIGDFTKIRPCDHEPIDLLVGGTPCQSFSVAGLRGGLADERGNLALEYLRLADRARPRWLVWENVPGVLSSNGGRDFGAILGGMVEFGYGVSYRILDAQYFGIPQRRRRVFVVGYLGDWRCAAAVLFERHSLQGHSPPRREVREGIAPTISARPTGGGGLGTDFDCDGGLIASHDIARPLLAKSNSSHRADAESYVAMALNAHGGSGRMDGESETFVTHSLRADGFDASEDGTGRGTPIIPIDMRQASRGEKLTNNRAHGSGGAPGHGVGNPGDPAFTVSERQQAIAFSAKDHGGDAGDVAPTLRASGHRNSHANGGVMPAIAIQERAVCVNPDAGPDGIGVRDDGLAYTLEARAVPQAAAYDSVVRRLTPRECERLQGFPDDFTLIPWRGKLAPDGPRYKALGNSMAVPVMRWIGGRIQAVEHLTHRCAA